MKELKRIIWILFAPLRALGNVNKKQTFYREGYLEERKKPKLRVDHTVVPESFLKRFPNWDSHLYENQEIIKG